MTDSGFATQFVFLSKTAMKIVSMKSSVWTESRNIIYTIKNKYTVEISHTSDLNRNLSIVLNIQSE